MNALASSAVPNPRPAGQKRAVTVSDYKMVKLVIKWPFREPLGYIAWRGIVRLRP